MADLARSQASPAFGGEVLAPGSRPALLRPTLRNVAVATAVLSYVWLAFTFLGRSPGPSWVSLLPPSTLFLAALLSALHLRSYGRAVAFLCLGLWLAALLDLTAGGGPLARWLALALTLLAGLLAGPLWASVAAFSFVAVCLLLPLGWVQQWPLLREAAFGVGLVWVVGGNIHQALVRAEASEQRWARSALDAMQRRGELQRTTKALRDMNALLERTNRELELARREAEDAKEIKARFAANVSHELRMPLNLILGFSHTMYATPEAYGDWRWPPELRLDIHEIYSASRHLLSMIDDILDLSRIAAQRLPLKLELSDLGALVQEAAATGRGLLRGSVVQLSVEMPTDLPPLLVDRVRIRQVLLNLLGNAARFTDEGSISVRACQRDGEVEVEVSDTGTGIPVEDLPTIFDEFSQAHGPITSGRGGTGLGLAVCREFVQLHGGRISVQSELGKGSVFRFWLPLPESGRALSRLSYYAPDGWSPPLPENRLGKSVVVLSPDEQVARQIARGVSGYRTIPTTDLDSLPQIIEVEHPAGVVLVRDPALPRQGPEAADVWAVTGRADLGVIEYETPVENLARRYLQVDGYLTKPVQVEQLLAAIEESGARPERFLIVDDDFGFRALMERVLITAFPQAMVRDCGGGAAALEVLAGQSFDLVLLDLLMPDVGGIEFLFQARKEGLLGQAKVLIVSGASYGEDLARLFPSRLVFSRKAPPRGQEWLNCIKALLDAAPPDYSRPAPVSES